MMKRTIYFFRTAQAAFTLLLTTLMLAAAPQTAQAQATIGGITYNDDGRYYEIDEVDDLSDLAVYVNGNGTYRNSNTNETKHDCEGLKFVMTQDIAYTCTTYWNDANSIENNFEAIGGSGALFKGDFDGAGNTISGIRIYHSGTADDDNYQGIFGRIGSGANIHGLCLADTRITGYQYIGGIVGDNTDGTITDCHVANDVCIHAAQSYAMWHGGIAGYNLSYSGVATVESCNSAATLTIADEENATGCYDYGAIVGLNSGTLTGNFAIGATVPAATDNRCGAIAGRNVGNNATLHHNYYTACTVADVENTTGVGCNNADVADNDGAVSVLAVTLDEGITITSPEQPAITYCGTGYYCIGQELTLSSTDPPAGYTYAYKVNEIDIQSNTYTVNLADGNVTISLTLVPIDWRTVNEGTIDDPYIIYNKDQLNFLASHLHTVEDGYSGKYFRLANDIAYTYGRQWNDATSVESNFEPIGGSGASFNGDFDGAGHTISGIRILRTSNTDDCNYKGIFGRIGDGAKIHGLRLANARITGYRYVGGIAGDNTNGTITDCHVANDVCIHAAQSSAFLHGGITGYNLSYTGGVATVESCTSAATLTIAPGATNCFDYGGIVGLNSGTLTGNFAIGATVPAADGRHGAIAGRNSSQYVNGVNTSFPLERNYYTACTVAGVKNATGVGCGNADFTYDEGAVPALRDDADNTQAIALLASLAQTDDDRPVLPLDLGWGAGKFPLQLADRTLYKDGDWNTLCLPFAVIDGDDTDDISFTGTPLEGAVVKILDSSSFADGTLTLNFVDATSIDAGKPYIVKWVKADNYLDDNEHNVFEPLFSDVAINANTPTEITTDCVTFHSSYSPVSFEANDRNKLFLGSGSTLYYPEAKMTIGSFRAYFLLNNGLVCGEPTQSGSGINAFVMNFGGEETNSIENGLLNIENEDGAWYDLIGRKLSGKPKSKGIYINNGRKFIIK